MRVTLTFEPRNETERAALKLLSIKEVSAAREHGTFEIWGEPDRLHRVLGAYLDVMKQVIIP